MNGANRTKVVGTASPLTPHPNTPSQGRRERTRSYFGLLLLFLVLPTLCGCNNQDADRLASFGKALAHKVDAMVAGSNGRIVRGWQTVPLQLGEVAIDARVSARLHWEKTLSEANIDVHAIGTSIELRGKVHNVEQRRKAVELAETTTGVDKVTDALEELP